jgi:hypothetical protein
MKGCNSINTCCSIEVIGIRSMRSEVLLEIFQQPALFFRFLSFGAPKERKFTTSEASDCIRFRVTGLQISHFKG